MRIGKKIIPILIITTNLYAGILFFLRQRILLVAGDFLVVQNQLQPSDMIHVIAEDDYQTDYAIQLYKQGYTKLIWVDARLAGYF